MDTIKPADIKLVQSFKNPPGAIKLVMEAVCVLLDLKPAKVPDPSGSGKKIDDYWEPSKKALGDPNFVTSLKAYDKDNIPPRMIETIRRVYTSNPDFTPAVAAKASSAAEGLCKWVCAMERYEEVAKVVAPKQAALKEAQGAYDTVMAALTIKQVCIRAGVGVCMERICTDGKQGLQGLVSHLPVFCGLSERGPSSTPGNPQFGSGAGAGGPQHPRTVCSCSGM